MKLAQNELIGLDPDEAVQGIFKDPDWRLKTTIGGLVSITSLVFVLLARELPIVVLFSICLWAVNIGYVLRAVRTRLKDPLAVLPKWDDWGDLFVSGMSWMAVTTAIGILFLGLSMTELLISAVFSAQKAYSDNFVFWSSATIIGITITHMFFSFVLSIVMINFAEEERMLSAFAYIKAARRFSKRPGDFIAAWLLGIGIQWMTFIFSIVTVIGIIFLPPFMFAAQVVAALLMGQAWRSAAHADLEPAITGTAGG